MPLSIADRGAEVIERESVMRLLTRALEENTLSADDRAYLASTVARRTGLSQDEAEQRVDKAYADAGAAATKVRDAANKARKTVMLGAFLTAATMAIALAAACAAAAMGAADRDKRTDPYWMGAVRFW